LNYSTTTEHHQAVSKEEIMSLPDLHGYWKYGDTVVPFRLPLAPVKIVAQGYVPRELPRVEVNLPALQPGSSDGHQNEQSAKQPDRPPLTPPDKKQHEHRIVEVENEHLISSVVTGSETAHGAAQNEIVIAEEGTGTASQITPEEMELESELD
jgi:hypothetical protein